jgi:hypothetical protein
VRTDPARALDLTYVLDRMQVLYLRCVPDLVCVLGPAHVEVATTVPGLAYVVLLLKPLPRARVWANRRGSLRAG